MSARRVFVVVGTRPEAIKLAPVVEALRRDGRLDAVLVATSQHREMLRQALRPFGLVPDIDLDVMTEGQIVESGSHDQLIALEGLYARSWTAQMRNISASKPAS